MKNITIQNLNGEKEQVKLLCTFEVSDLAKSFAILSRDEVLKEGMSKVYISEINQDTPGVYKFVNIIDESVWDKVKQSMKEIVQGGNVNGKVFEGDNVINEGSKVIGIKDTDKEKLANYVNESSFDIPVQESIIENTVTPEVQVEQAPVQPVEENVFERMATQEAVSPVVETPVVSEAATLEVPVAPIPEVETSAVPEQNMFDAPAMESPVAPEAPAFEVPVAPMPEVETPAVPEQNMFDAPAMESPVAPEAPAFEVPVAPMPEVETPAVPEQNMFDAPAMESSVVPETPVANETIQLETPQEFYQESNTEVPAQNNDNNDLAMSHIADALMGLSAVADAISKAVEAIDKKNEIIDGLNAKIELLTGELEIAKSKLQNMNQGQAPVANPSEITEGGFTKQLINPTAF